MTQHPSNQLLAICASLQGQPAAAVRFHLEPDTTSGLDDIAKVQLRWRQVFSEGRAEKLIGPLQKEDLPVLWLSSDDQQACVVQSLSVRGVNVLDDERHSHSVDLKQLERGTFIKLTVNSGTQQIAQDQEHPVSAGDWFKFAIWKRRRVFLDGGLATLLISLMALATSLYTMQVYDRVIPLSGYSTLLVLSIGVLLTIGFELMLRHARLLMIERACKAIDQEISEVLLAKALSIRMDARPRSIGTFASQIRQFESVRNFLTSTTLLVLADIPVALLFWAVIASIAGSLVIAPLICVPVAVIAGVVFRHRLAKLTGQQQKEVNRKNGLLMEVVDGAESIKAAGAQWQFLGAWRKTLEQLSSKELKIKVLSNLSSHLTQSVQQLSYVLIVALGSIAVIRGDLTMGGLIACSIISSRAIQPLAQLPATLLQWESAKASLMTLDAMMALPDDRAPDQHLSTPQEFKGVMRLHELEFGYQPGVRVLSCPNLTFEAGERTAILGSVGSGKSTMIKILSGLYMPSKGKYFVDQMDAFQLSPEFLNAYIAYLPQDVRLFAGTLRSNLTLGLGLVADSEIMRIAQGCGLGSLIANHPKGLDLDIQEGGRGLSGGQRQLVGIARILLSKPKVALLDEPTASMDNNLEVQVLQFFFQNLPPTTGVILTTHKIQALRHVTRVMLMDQGRVALDGPRDEIMRKIGAAA
jgi:ATP-binding cassette subfamily C protein LapB